MSHPELDRRYGRRTANTTGVNGLKIFGGALCASNTQAAHRSHPAAIGSPSPAGWADAALRDMPAILVTSRAAPEDRQRGRDVGAQGYVVKSEFDQAELLAMTKPLIG